MARVPSTSARWKTTRSSARSIVSVAVGVPSARFAARILLSGSLYVRETRRSRPGGRVRRVVGMPDCIDGSETLSIRDCDVLGLTGRRDSPNDERVTGRAWTRARAARRIRHAFEFRHPEMLTAGILRMLRAHGVALVFSHNGGEWPYVEELTAGFVYIRLHGAPRTYLSLYGDSFTGWADRVRTWASGGEPPDAVRITDRPPPRPQVT